MGKLKRRGSGTENANAGPKLVGRDTSQYFIRHVPVQFSRTLPFELPAAVEFW